MKSTKKGKAKPSIVEYLGIKCGGNGIRIWPDCFEDCPYEYDEKTRKEICGGIER